jgi:mRNA-decapping enzyme subunit 2
MTDHPPLLAGSGIPIFDDEIEFDDNHTKLQQQAYSDALDEVHTRFILNLPPEELASSDRIMFQLEQAWWFYEDMICDRASPDLNMPRFSNLKPFCKILFEMSPLLDSLGDFNTMWTEFSAYKRKISTYGTILLNDETTTINEVSGKQEQSFKIILCQLWNGNTWTLPAGKINQGESGDAAAARETFEETGFDPNCRFGLTKKWKEEEEAAITAGVPVVTSKVTWMHPLRDEDALTCK